LSKQTSPYKNELPAVEVPKHRKKRSKKKPYKVVAKNFRLTKGHEPYDMLMGRYTTEESAKEGLKAIKTGWWGRYELVIERD
jgi:hypothetical protein